MFVSEIIPNLWVCDYDLITSHYFNNRNIGLYIHVYSFQNEISEIGPQMKRKIGHNQELINIQIKDIDFNMINSSNRLIQRQMMRYSKDFADLIHNYIEIIQNILKYKRGVVLFSKYGIQKAAIIAASYLILKGKITVDSSINIMKSKEPMFFKNINNVNVNVNVMDNSNITTVTDVVLYKYTLHYII